MKKALLIAGIELVIIILLLRVLFGCTIFSATGLREDAARVSSVWFQGIENQGGDDVVLSVNPFVLVIHVEGHADMSYAGMACANRIEIIGKRTKHGIVIDPMILGFELGNYLALHNPEIAMPEYWKDSGL